MSYKQESKKAFIACQTELLANEIYLHYKYHNNPIGNVETLLSGALNTNWPLSEKEKATILKNAIIIAKQKIC